VARAQRGCSSITRAAKTTPCNLSLGDEAHPWAQAASLNRRKQITFYIRDPKKKKKTGEKKKEKRPVIVYGNTCEKERKRRPMYVYVCTYTHTHTRIIIIIIISGKINETQVIFEVAALTPPR